MSDDFGGNELAKRQEAKASALDEQLKDYILEWREQRAKEEEELKTLKEKQATRKVEREEEEKKMAERKKTEEERKAREAEEKKQKENEEKRRRLEEAEKKRLAMMAALKEQKEKSKGPNLKIGKRPSMQLSAAQLERNKTKEQLEEEKKISLGIRIKPLNTAELENFSLDRLKFRVIEFWDNIVKLETEKYDLEERERRQEYDLKELKERQRQQLRHKALKKGLDPEALTGRYPPKIQVASKYERRVDTRSYDDKKNLFEGGWKTLTAEEKEKVWRTRAEQFTKRRHRKLPKWFGERPGKKKDPDAPESPEEEEEVVMEEEPPHYEDFDISLSGSEKGEGDASGGEHEEGEEEEEEEEDEEEEEESEDEEEEEESEEE